MSNPEVGLACVVLTLVLVYAGMWVPFALMGVSYVGVWLIKGSPVLAGKLLALSAADTLSSYFFGVVPLFVLMGYIVSESGMGRDAFDVAHRAFRRFRSGLGVATVFANALFAAVTGISIASAAVFSRIAVPEMTRRGYQPQFSAGLVAGSSVLGMLIPPSLLLILYGLLTEQSIGDLFIAGLLPGLLLALLFALGVIAMSKFAPAAVYQHDPDTATPEAPDSLLSLLRRLLPLLGLVVIIFGGIYSGLFTPIEAGATGCLAAFLIGLTRGQLTFARLKSVLSGTGAVTASVCMLLIAAQTYGKMLSLSGLPVALADFLGDGQLGYWRTIFAYVGVVIILGTLLDSASIMLIMVPLSLPVMIGLDVDLVWFGIVTVLAVEVGLLTPPFGMSVFAVKAAINDPSVSLFAIYRGAAPFTVLMMVALLLVILIPWLATGLLH